MLHHRDPYGPEVTREIQAGYYGRPLEPGRADDPKDQQGFAYPVHVVFLLAPTIGLPFPVVQTGFRWLLVNAAVLEDGTLLMDLEHGRVIEQLPHCSTRSLAGSPSSSVQGART